MRGWLPRTIVRQQTAGASPAALGAEPHTQQQALLTPSHGCAPADGGGEPSGFGNKVPKSGARGDVVSLPPHDPSPPETSTLDLPSPLRIRRPSLAPTHAMPCQTLGQACPTAPAEASLSRAVLFALLASKRMAAAEQPAEGLPTRQRGQQAAGGQQPAQHMHQAACEALCSSQQK